MNKKRQRTVCIDTEKYKKCLNAAFKMLMRVDPDVVVMIGDAPEFREIYEQTGIQVKVLPAGSSYPKCDLVFNLPLNYLMRMNGEEGQVTVCDEFQKLATSPAYRATIDELRRDQEDFRSNGSDINNNLAAKLQKLDAEKSMLDAARPFPQHTLATLREKLALEWTYHSNAIEGNTLTLRETKVVLEGITIGGKSLNEHLEAINHSHAIDFVQGLVNSGIDLGEREIKEIHQLVLSGINNNEAGRYRRENVVIAGASTTPPSFLHLNDEMEGLLTWHRGANDMHPVERAAEFHTRFVEIHPFVDGNGRTGRLLLNFELMKAGYPPAVIRKEDRIAYYDALDDACVTRDYHRITELVADAVQRSMTIYLELIDPQNNQDLKSDPDEVLGSKPKI